MDRPERRLLMETFLEEAEEHFAALASGILSLEARPADAGLLDSLFRSAHNLKGAAKVVGVGELERTAHALESVFAELRAGRLKAGAAVVDGLLEANDAMRACLEDLAEKRPLRDTEPAAERLMSLLSGGEGWDRRLAELFPGLDPEVRDVLTEFQRSELVHAREAGKTCWELELEVPQKDFSSRVHQVRAKLKDLGETLSVAGLSPRAEGSLRLKFLLAGRRSASQIEAFCRGERLKLSDPAAAALLVPEPAGSTAEEVEFAREMERLRAQFLTETAERVEEMGRLVLALEQRPDDEELVNTLFREAHSLKGSGTTYGLPAVSAVSHHLESVLDKLRSRSLKADARLADAMLKGVDLLKELFIEAKEGRLAPDRPLPAVRDLEAALLGGAAAAPVPAAPRPEGALKVEFKDSIRVKLDKLDRLMNLSSELTISRNTREAALKDVETQSDRARDALRAWQGLKGSLQLEPALLHGFREKGLSPAFDELGESLSELQRRLEALWNGFGATSLHAAARVDALQEEVLRIRTVPVSLLFDNAARLVRDLTRDGTKQARLSVSGARTELDKKVLEQMADPLMHLLRNAVDHGLETAQARQAAGKPPCGQIELSAEPRGRQVVITVKDDGRGMDPAVLIAKALEKGLVTPADAAKLSPEQAFGFIFLPGFSTKAEVTELSGRGVGMDVVRNNVESLKGRIEVESRPGRGTIFTIRLPLSVAVIQVVLVESSGQTFCLQTDSISDIVQVSEEELQTEDGRPCLGHRGRTIPIVRLSALLGLPQSPAARFPVVVAAGLEGTVGFAVDRALTEETVVLKEMGGLLRRAPHVAGGTFLPDGSVAVILDTASLLAAAGRGSAAWAPSGPRAEEAKKRVLVVDDSLTTRELLRGLLETAGFRVETAENGREALNRLAREGVDLVVTDVQMPEMDGYALTRAIKSDRKLSETPVVMVTALSKEEERLRGLEAGADAYVVKGAFDQGGLLSRARELLGGGHG